MDQTNLGDRMAVLMITLLVGAPVAAFAWLAEEGAANIGFAKRKILLDSVLMWIPGSAKDMLLADLFYPSIGLFQWLKVQAWHVRLRLKGNRFSAGRFVTGTCRPSGTVDTDHGVGHALVRPDWSGRCHATSDTAKKRTRR